MPPLFGASASPGGAHIDAASSSAAGNTKADFQCRVIMSGPPLWLDLLGDQPRRLLAVSIASSTLRELSTPTFVLRRSKWAAQRDKLASNCAAAADSQLADGGAGISHNGG